MLDTIIKYVGLIRLADVAPPKPSPRKRSSAWPEWSDRYMARHPFCAVTGRLIWRNGKFIVEAALHHIVPFHLDPERELDETNVLPMTEAPPFNAHLIVGHLGDWRSFNPEVVEDARKWREKILCRPYFLKIG